MKKYMYLFMLAATFTLAACDVETDIEPGGTSVEKMAGVWTVTVDAVDQAGNIVLKDPFGLGYSEVSTYNTAANTDKEMWIDDGGNFWDYKLKVDTDYAARTFTSNGAKDNVSYECKVNIDGGKVMAGKATTPSGMPADSIIFYVSFDDDDNPANYEFAKYKVSGFRYTGFPKDQ